MMSQTALQQIVARVTRQVRESLIANGFSNSVKPTLPNVSNAVNTTLCGDDIEKLVRRNSNGSQSPPPSDNPADVQ